jgi:hypothetical protein
VGRRDAARRSNGYGAPLGPEAQTWALGICQLGIVEERRESSFTVWRVDIRAYRQRVARMKEE